MDVVSMADFDPLGRLSRFESALHLDPATALVRIRGSIDAGELTLTARAGDVTYEPPKMPISEKAMMGDALAPQARLPGLREGQTWTVELYSPLRPPTSPTEVLQATVERKQRIVWQGEEVETWEVVYRDKLASGDAHERLRGKMWVRPDGVVLRQQAVLFGNGLTFTRLSRERALELKRKLDAMPLRPWAAYAPDGQRTHGVSNYAEIQEAVWR
jgi:hypothetical protein